MMKALSLLAATLLAAPAAAQNIVAVSVDRQALLALDSLSGSRQGDIVTIRGYTVFGETRGDAKMGYVLAGRYEFECDDTPRLRSRHSVLFNYSRVAVDHVEEPWSDIDTSYQDNHTYNVYRAACSFEELETSGGAQSIFDLSEVYFQKIRTRQIR